MERLPPTKSLAGLAIAVLLLVGACMPKVPSVVLETSRPVRVAMVFDRESSPEVEGLPASLQEGLLDVLRERNLVPELVPVERFAEDFGRRRATAQRLEWLAAQASSDELLLLVEARAIYYSQLSGKWRWTVAVEATMALPGGSFPLDESLETPVFLDFAHEQEQEALEAARLVVSRRLARLVDTALGGLDDPERAASLAAPAEADVDSGWGPVYFVMVDRFANGDPSNDGLVSPDDPQGFHGGDLRGVLERVDALHELGVRTLWLSPIFGMRSEPVGPWGAYHGYWLADPYVIEPRFGTEEDLRALADALHARDMKLVLDFVANHVGPDTAVTRDHPDWLHRRGDIVDWDDPEQVLKHDVHGLPDLDQENEEVYAWLLGAALTWIERVGVDGYRLDAVRHVPSSFWSRFNADVRAAAGEDFLLIGELFDGDPLAVAEAWRAGGFGAMFDFPLHYAMVDVFCRDASPGRIASVLSADRHYDAPERLATFVDNHDLPRIATACGGDLERVEQLLVFLGAARGEPVLSWGTELPLEGAQEPDNRADMDWEAEQRLAPLLREVIGARSQLPATSHILELEDGRLRYVRGGRVEVLVQDGRVELAPFEGQLPSSEPGELAFALREAPGSEILLVGAGPELGNWDPQRGLALEPELSLSLPGGTVLEYKFVVRAADGALLWEDRPNRYVLVRAGEQLRIDAHWNS